MENASEQDLQAITLNDLLKSESVVLQRTTGLRPVITFFLQPYPSGTYAPDPDSEYCEERRLNLTAEGTPLHLSRSPTIPTAIYTPGHTIPAGYTRGGKWKNSTYVPGKTDMRAGK